MYTRIITHDDLDGIASAALCARFLGIRQYLFTGPRSITESRVVPTPADVVCDLPCPMECGLWFDHHEGNREECALRGIRIEDVPGAFAPKPSCSRVVLDHFGKSHPIPEHFPGLVDQVDIVDSFSYESIEEWRKETPGRILDASLKVQDTSPFEKHRFMSTLVDMLQNIPADQAALVPDVRDRYLRFVEEEKRMIDRISQDASFLPEDGDRTLVILDLTKHNQQPRIVKHLAHLLFPETLGVLEIRNMYRQNVKTNDLSVSMALSIRLNQTPHTKDVGELMRRLNIGDGHAGAGSGTIACASKSDMLKTKEKIIKTLFTLWRAQ
jgi:hypothetical protein